MKIAPLGIDFSTGNLLFDPIDEEKIAEQTLEFLSPRKEQIRKEGTLTTTTVALRDFAAPPGTSPNYADPREVGWTFLINPAGEHTEKYISCLEQLARHRGMRDPGKPIYYNGEKDTEWIDWYDTKFQPFQLGSTAPYYVLIVGGPDEIPFSLQSYLDLYGCVGRVDLPLKDLTTYVNKILRLERDTNTSIKRKAIFFAPDHGIIEDKAGYLQWDPTHYSNMSLARPLIVETKSQGFEVLAMLEKKATKVNFMSAKETNPALVFCAGHGAMDMSNSQNIEWQKSYTGALVCQEWDARNFNPTNDITEANLNKWLFAANDVPNDKKAFFEGSVFFQFACLGYGTPKETEINSWLYGGQKPEFKFKGQFISALPKALLAHPRGPIAYMGHVDMAVAYSFVKPQEYNEATVSTRLKPFSFALLSLLAQRLPVGMALEDMNKRYALSSVNIAERLDKIERPTPGINKREQEKARDLLKKELLHNFIMRIDAKNYFLFGDPAARIILPLQ